MEPPKNTAGRQTRISLVLPGTLKDYAISAGLGLVLFSDEAALPSVVMTVVMTVIMIPYILLFDLFIVHGRKKFTQN